MVKYDPNVIQKFADSLYKRAMTIVGTYAVMGLLLGAAAAFLAVGLGAGKPNVGVAVAGGIIGLVIGYVVGSEKAFRLKLEAQTALCQVKIEENTRPQNGG